MLNGDSNVVTGRKRKDKTYTNLGSENTARWGFKNAGDNGFAMRKLEGKENRQNKHGCVRDMHVFSGGLTSFGLPMGGSHGSHGLPCVPMSSTLFWPPNDDNFRVLGAARTCRQN